jgi:serine/threonine protein kinase/tetratricopeptide (TPR) repeat protein
MLCPHCRAYNSNNAVVCDRCAKPLVEPGAADDVTFVGGDSYAPMPPTGGGSGGAARTPSPTPSASARSWPSNSAALFSLQPGADFGPRYHIEAQIGEGGMGTVYKALDKELDRAVALKLIRPEMTSDEGVLQRFKQELLLASKISHKNVLRIHDLGEVQGVKFISMAFIEGQDLHHVLNTHGRLSIELAIKISRQLLEALDAAHAAGVVHRDLKPQNILVDSAEQIFVSDFGLAKSLQAGAAAMTRTGEFLGTPRYMAPEQVEAKPVDNRTDLYAFGLILYEMVTGDIPFKADSTLALMYQRVKEKPVSPKTENPEVPDYLVRIILRSLEVDPARRYQSAKEILADLDAQRAPSRSRSVQIVLPIPETRSGWLVLVGSLVLFVVLALAIPPVRGWIFSLGKRGPAATVSSKAVTLLVADFSNEAGDSVFDGALESPFTIAVEGASFISTYKRGDARKKAAQLQPGATALNESLARLVAVREGINVVVTGSISAQGGRYKLGVKAIDAATGRELAKYETDADDKEAVLKAVGKLAARVRTALGDTTPESIQIAAAETFTAGSLEAARQYAVAQDLQYAGKWQEAIGNYSKAVELDPEMGRAYSGIAALYANMGRLSDADKYYKLAFSKIDRMSEREKYRTRGGYYLVFRNPDKAIEELSELVKRFPTDTAGTANLGVAYLNKREMSKALEAERRAVELSPKNVPQRNNLGLFAMYASDFEMGIREQQAVLGMNPSFEKGYVGLALSQLAGGHPADAVETFRKLEKLGASGASTAAVGLADIALYEGRTPDALTILEKGLAEDQRNKSDAESLATKLIMLAQAQWLAGRAPQALASADKAIATSRAESVLFWTAQLYLNLNREPKAAALAAELAKGLGPDPQAEAKIIEGEILLKQGKARDAIQTLLEARKLADTWLGRFDLGRAYLEAGEFTEAYSEFEVCLKRRGEATALFFDEVPTYRIFPAVYFYMGRSQEGLKSPAAAESFKAFLAIKEKGGGDPLDADAKKRLAGR